MTPPTHALATLLRLHPGLGPLILTVDGIPLNAVTGAVGSHALLRVRCPACDRVPDGDGRAVTLVREAADRAPERLGWCRSCSISHARRTSATTAAPPPTAALLSDRPDLAPLLRETAPPTALTFDRAVNATPTAGATKTRRWWAPRATCPQCTFDGGYACSVAVRRLHGTDWCPHDRAPMPDTSALAQLRAAGLEDSVVSAEGIPPARLMAYLAAILPGRHSLRWRCATCRGEWSARISKRLGENGRSGTRCPTCFPPGRPPKSGAPAFL